MKVLLLLITFSALAIGQCTSPCINATFVGGGTSTLTTSAINTTGATLLVLVSNGQPNATWGHSDSQANYWECTARQNGRQQHGHSNLLFLEAYQLRRCAGAKHIAHVYLRSGRKLYNNV